MLDTYCYLCIFSGIVGPVPYGGSYEITAVCLSVCPHGMHSPLRLGGGGEDGGRLKFLEKPLLWRGVGWVVESEIFILVVCGGRGGGYIVGGGLSLVGWIT